jgi:hypothetical protein
MCRSAKATPGDGKVRWAKVPTCCHRPASRGCLASSARHRDEAHRAS